jgi:hypothetical protein
MKIMADTIIICLEMDHPKTMSVAEFLNEFI